MKSQKTVILLVVAVFLWSGCLHRESYSTRSIIDNSSAHAIKIEHYRGDSLYNPSNQYTVSINPNEVKLVGQDSDSGPGPGLTYAGVIVGADFDSVVITFDNLKKSVHYSINKSGNNPNAVVFSNPRNIFNPSNWTERIITDTKKRDEREYKYTFTEQDYLDAQ